MTNVNKRGSVVKLAQSMLRFFMLSDLFRLQFPEHTSFRLKFESDHFRMYSDVGKLRAFRVLDDSIKMTPDGMNMILEEFWYSSQAGLFK